MSHVDVGYSAVFSGLVEGSDVDRGVFEPVAGAFEGDDFGVVDDAVDHGRGDDLVAEDVSPAGEGQVLGQDQRGVLVAGGDELEEQVRGVLLERDVADLVDDDQSVAAQPDEFLGQPPALVGRLEPGDPVDGGGEQHPVAELGGRDARAGREVGFAGAGRAEQDDVAAPR